MEMVEKFLTDELGFINYFILMAEPISAEMGNVTEEDITAFRQAILESPRIPPEFRRMGIAEVGVYLEAMGYNFAREVLLDACKSRK